MQNIQLYIEGNRMDMFKDESVSLTQTIQNVRDIGKVFTNFTKTFSLPASKDNNKVFQHYYNFNIVDGYDGRVKKNATIELNFLPFEKGKIKLEGVDLKDNKPYAYRVTFFGNTVDLKDVLGEDTLQVLDWLDNFKKTYDSSTVKIALVTGLNTTVDSVTYNDSIIAPLITHTTRLFYDSSVTGSADVEYPNASGGNLYYRTGSHHHHGVYYGELKYAIRLHLIILAIQEKYPELQFSTDFFNTSNDTYHNLYMWMHRKKGPVEDPNQLATYSEYVDFGLDSTMTNVLAQGESVIVSNQTGLNKITSDLTVRPQTGETARYEVNVIKDGVLYANYSATGGDIVETIELTNGTYKVEIVVTETMTFGETGVENAVSWEMSDLQVPESHTFNVTEFDVEAIVEFYPTKQIPTMKVIDFLTGLFKMFNLTAFVEDDGTIKVQTLDNFYANNQSSGSPYDITEYVKMDSSQIDVALPYKEIIFKYAGLGTKLAEQHKQLTDSGIGWGTAEYRGTGNDDELALTGDVYTVEVPFEHLKYERLRDGNTTTDTTIQVGWFVDDNDDAYYGKPLLFYPIQISSGTVISFLNQESSGSGSHSSASSYFIPSNSVAINSSTSKVNINFDLENNEYTRDASFTDTLFDDYYTNYITDVFNSKRRLTKVKAFIPLKILRSYNLSDRFIIADKIYIINSITTNLGTGESDLELLNVV